ncbi:MAG: hypothetical protein KJ571_19655 [Bacteroidetes bacterium]|nr:hypothetical protein [Bacteroidota bacterium]
MNTFFPALLFIFMFCTPKSDAQIFNNLDESYQHIVEYIISDRFHEIKRNSDDLTQIDSIYLEALNISENDISEALLVLTFATLPFDKMPVKIPFIGNNFDLILQEIDPVLLKKKNNNLPSKLFFNTPPGGDKDKLAHFFGNAFLAYNISFFNISKILGIFVELFEESFKVSGGLDYRDIEANNFGEFFGIMLNKNRKILPSEVLSFYILHQLKFYN